MKIQRRSAWTAAATAVAVTAGVLLATAGGASASSGGSQAEVKVLTPREGDLAGTDSRAWFVDLRINFRAGAAGLKTSGFTAPQLTGPPPHANALPFSGAFATGHDDRLPGLVVLTSTTINNNTTFHGPATNLAGLFNLTGISDRSADRTQILDTWIVGAAIAGTGPTTLTVAVLKGTAPDVIPDADHDGKIDEHDLEALGVISNIETVDFSINGAPA